MINRIRTICPRGLNKGFSLKFCVGSRVRYQTFYESRRAYLPKRCECNNEDENNSPNILSIKKTFNYFFNIWRYSLIIDTEN